MSEPHISPEKQRQLRRRMHANGLYEKDLIEKFVLGSGKGGQKVNKTASCVYLQHTPTGLEVKCQQARSRALNRYRARCLLCEKLETRTQGLESERQQREAKIRRQKRRRSRRQKQKMLDEKRRQGEKKRWRKTVVSGEEG